MYDYFLCSRRRQSRRHMQWGDCISNRDWRHWSAFVRCGSLTEHSLPRGVPVSWLAYGMLVRLLLQLVNALVRLSHSD